MKKKEHTRTDSKEDALPCSWLLKQTYCTCRAHAQIRHARDPASSIMFEFSDCSFASEAECHHCTPTAVTSPQSLTLLAWSLDRDWLGELISGCETHVPVSAQVFILCLRGTTPPFSDFDTRLSRGRVASVLVHQLAVAPTRTVTIFACLRN